MGTAESDMTEIRVLLARAQAGDERAFRALVARFLPVFGFPAVPTSARSP